MRLSEPPSAPFELLLRVSPEGGADLRVCSVEVSAGQRVSDLAAALAVALGVPGTGHRLWVDRLHALPDPADDLADTDLRTGDTVALIAPDRPAAEPPTLGDGPEIVVCAGQDAGRRHLLAAGDTIVGRSAPAELIVRDAMVSRRHARISVDGSGVAVEDLGSANGTFLDGRKLSGREPLDPAGLLEVGDTMLRLDVRATPNRFPVRAGRVLFNRPPRSAVSAAREALRAPVPPETVVSHRIPLVPMLAPLALGVPMVAISATTGNRAMLVVGLVSLLLSGLMALASQWEDRRGRSGEFRGATLRFRNALDALDAAARDQLAKEVAQRRAAAPDVVELASRVTSIAPTLWERRREDPDYLHLGVGWADQPAQLRIDLPDGGDESLRAEARQRVAAWSTARAVPVVVPLAEVGVCGLSGDHAAVAGLARWLALQAAALHSPRDVVLTGVFGADERSSWGWLHWLPHLRSEASPVGAAHCAFGLDEGAALVESLSAVVRSRLRGKDAGAAAADAEPTIVVFLSERVPIPLNRLITLLEDGPAVGVCTVWLGARPADLPGACVATVACSSSPPRAVLAYPRRGESVGPALLDQVGCPAAENLAAAMSCIADTAAATATGQLPAAVGLAAALRLTAQDLPATIQARWAGRSSDLSAVLGVGVGGEFRVDLRRDGPHALVGGTTGAGKSELLQSLVASLALSHPPTRVSFLLVDYKGGAAFKDVVHLPHTAGFVTDLDGHLVQRALVSLNAELHRREHLLREHGAKDLIELERRLPEAAPASLILVVDEFATLAKELPEFVDGVVNVAQRGRSLGIHLVLATQRPAGAINDNIRANTNLRVALRMNDEPDSQDVIDSKVAAHLPRTLAGRAYVRTGKTELTEVQIAYGGGSELAGPTRRPVRPKVRFIDPAGTGAASDAGSGGAPAAGDPAAGIESPSDLQVLVEAARRAAAEGGFSSPPSPWLDPLPDLLQTTDLGPAAGPDRFLLGLTDVPSRQAQVARWFDLEDEGSLLVYGASGSGKTTLLRSVAASLASGQSPAEINIYALDFASRGLTSLAPLPHVGAVIADDAERVQRLITVLADEAQRRRRAFGESGAAVLSEHRRLAPGSTMPRLVVLLDGYGTFAAEFERIDYGVWLERLSALVAEGRPLGIHFVLTTDRRAAVPFSLTTAVPSKVVLRMADDDEYGALGLDARLTKGVALPPGRGFVDATVEVQVPVVGDAPAGDGQAASLADLGARLRAEHPGQSVPDIQRMPAEVALADLGPPDPGRAAVGIRQRHRDVGVLDLSESHALVAGPPRSGKSTTLGTIAASFTLGRPDIRAVLLAPRRSPLTALGLWDEVAQGVERCGEIAAALVESLDDDDAPDVLVVVDDATELTDTEADEALERLARRGRDGGARLVVAGDNGLVRRAYGGVLTEVRRDRQGILLRPDPDMDSDLLGGAVPRVRPEFWLPGRGVLVVEGQSDVVQVARFGDSPQPIHTVQNQPAITGHAITGGE